MTSGAAEFKWKLEDIYADDQLWELDYRRVERLLGAMEIHQGKLANSAQQLLTALQCRDQLEMLNEKVYTYAAMRLDENNANPTYQALRDRAIALNTKVNTATAYLVPEILALPKDKIHDFCQQEPGLQPYRFFLQELMRQRPHVLSQEEEKILAQVGEIAQAPKHIFGMINNADFIFPSITDEQGRELEVTQGSYRSLMLNSNRQIRQDAFNSLYSVYHRYKNTLAATLNASVKRDIFYARIRKHPSALAAALFADNVSPEVYDNLIETVRKNLHLMHRYMALRKKVLGVEELHLYDIYAPLVKDIQWEISYPEAVKMVQQGLAPLGEDYINDMNKAFEHGWIDVYERQGKTSGAYSWGPYGVHPYILMNYQDNLPDVFTLAHELGHAMHSYYSYNTQPYINAHYSIFTAEVASTVNEALLMQYLLNTVTERDKKLYLINYYLEQIRGTLFRQVMFAEFEKIIHQRAEAGEALTAESLSDIYRQLNTDYHGPEMVIDEQANLEWARIPHFYNAFYVYKYATGISAATALCKQITAQGGPAKERYLEFLKSGGSDYPTSLLKNAGVDMTRPDPVQQTLDLFAELLVEMEKLMLQK